MVVERMAKVIDDSTEPTTALWSNMGKGRCRRKQRMFQGVRKVLTVWTAIGILVYAPIAYYITIPFGLAQHSPSPLTGQFVGIALAVAGLVLDSVAWNATAFVGFHSKTKQDSVFVVMSTLTNLLNTFLFGGGGLLYYIAQGFNTVDMSDLSENSPRKLRRELELFRAFFVFLIPGWLFAGIITGKFMGIVIPVVQTFLMARLAYVWRWVPRPIAALVCMILPGSPPATWLSAREAEVMFAPPNMSVAWEYNVYIVTPSVCFLALFVMSAQAWKIFAFLALWAFMMYLIHRFVTVPTSRKETVGESLDETAEKLWGIPLAIVLASFGFWGVRCEALGSNDALTSYWIVLLLFLFGLLLHQFALQLLGPHSLAHTDLVDRSYEDVRRKLRYTWFNVNPVHVLKSRFCPEELGPERAGIIAPIPFEFGKEYLQLS